IKLLKETMAAEKIMERIYSNYERYEYNDQDVLNEMYYDTLKYLPWEKYNCPPALYILGKENGNYLSYDMIKAANSGEIKNVTEDVKNAAAVIHYMANTKPWSKNRENSSVYNLFDPLYFEARRDAGLEPDFKELSDMYAERNYSETYLECMLKALAFPQVDTVILGGDSGLFDVDTKMLTHQVNLCVEDFDFATGNRIYEEALQRAKKGQIKKLILILEENAVCKRTQNAADIFSSERWTFAANKGLCNADKAAVEESLKKAILEKGSYFSDIHKRKTFEKMDECIDDEKAASKNKDMIENICRLATNDGAKLIFIVPPHANESEKPDKIPENLLNVLNEMPYEAEYYNMNDLVKEDFFVLDDFWDEKHLNEVGAQKFTKLLIGL
ncbi:MAG: hypothetical protein K6G40_08905, partial [Eubacterium sp.]|nr:hypothetical protein [Eubacterium sp.]